MYRNVNEHVLTKEELRTMYETRADLVGRVSSFGAEIPTTSMQWKREAHELEWIVRQMSWAPPWTPAEPGTVMEEKTRLCRPEEARGVAPAMDAAETRLDEMPPSVKDEEGDADRLRHRRSER